jgi:mRNA-degrading endonuclease YafQ of YafQ-DinJ toxin-antitoxin module
MKDEQENIGFGENVVPKEDFLRRWREIGPELQQTVRRKIALLLENRAHPSLKVHRLRKATEDIWVCYISSRRRLLYQFNGEILLLLDLGSHSVVDRY